MMIYKKKDGTSKQSVALYLESTLVKQLEKLAGNERFTDYIRRVLKEHVAKGEK